MQLLTLSLWFITFWEGLLDSLLLCMKYCLCTKHVSAENLAMAALSSPT